MSNEKDKFLRVLEKTLKREGTYSFDRDDPGGETFYGISRKYHSTWEGWKILDSLSIRKKKNPKLLDPSTREELSKLVSSFYYELFWKPLGLDKLPETSISYALFDCAVNCGHRRAVRFLQRSLNALNKTGKLWDDLRVDGLMGPRTITTLRECYDHNLSDYLLLTMEALRVAFYVELTERSPSLEKFFLGWLNRSKASPSVQGGPSRGYLVKITKNHIEKHLYEIVFVEGDPWEGLDSKS